MCNVCNMLAISSQRCSSFAPCKLHVMMIGFVFVLDVTMIHSVLHRINVRFSAGADVVTSNVQCWRLPGMWNGADSSLADFQDAGVAKRILKETGFKTGVTQHTGLWWGLSGGFKQHTNKKYTDKKWSERVKRWFCV